MIGPDLSIVPSLMFHSVGLDRSEWMWRSLSESVECFEGKLHRFVRHGCASAFWAEVYAHVANKRRLPLNTIMLTFDDGYLDNWVFVWPLLQRYGIKATVFASSEFIEPDGPPRPTLADVWSGAARREDLQVAGFLRPSEIRCMVDSGLIDVQSHASSHTWWFGGNRLVDVYTPRKYSRYPWLAWNARPARKPFYLTEDQSSYVRSGQPILEYAKAAVVRRFHPDEGAVEEFCAKWVDHAGGDDIPKEREQEVLKQIVADMGVATGWPGIQETETERVARLEDELKASRQTLETITGRPVEFICWPGGAYDAVALDVARHCGFRAYTLGSSDQSHFRNRPGADPGVLKRIGTENHLFVHGIDCGVKGDWYQWLRIRAHQDSWLYRVVLFGYKALQVSLASLRGLFP